MSDIEPKQYSERLGVIAPEQIQRALDRFDAGTLVAAESAPGGLFGQNIMLETTRGAFVLRGHPHHDMQFPRERYFAALVNERTPLAAPWPYDIDGDTTIFGWSYCLMPRLAGETLTIDDIRALPPDERRDLARAYGEGLAALQQATWPEHAWPSGADGALVPLGKPYADWYGEWTEYWLDLCLQGSDATTADDIAWVRAIIADTHDALAVPLTAALVHTDYAPGNVLVERDADGRRRVTGVVDLADCYMGDGEADLARLYRALHGIDREAASIFARAYAGARPPRPRAAERWRHYVLRDHLIFWEYGQRNGVWFRPGMTLRDFAQAQVEGQCPL